MKRLHFLRVLTIGLWPLAILAAFSNIAKAEDAVLMDFYSEWCGPCRAMSPTVDALENAGYRVQRIDVDRQAALAGRYGVEKIPCFIAVVDGKETDRIVGGCSYEQLEAMAKRPASIRHSPSFIDNPKSPRPAWRYEQPTGYRAAVVRIYCQNEGTTRSIGSGALIRWNGRIVVLTARHVIKGAQNILVELCTRKTHWAKIIKADVVWDCAVLELVGSPEGVEPVEVELGDQAMQQSGDRLESCGYGPDGKLACNTGLFQGYRRSTETPQGPDDWLVISGRARGGDSGGPVFNERGRLVGVLWGTDGKEVVCVQAGRLHRLLDDAVAKQNTTSTAIPQSLETVLQRIPTPAKQPETDEARQECLRNLFGARRPPSPAPNVIVQSDPELRRIMGDIDAKVGSLVQQKQQEPEVRQEETSPAIAGLCVLGAVVVGFVMYFSVRKE